MDVAARTGGYGAEQIPRYHDIGGRAADTALRLRRNTAGAVGAEFTADPLQPESAVGFLALHPVMACFHRQTGDKAFQWLVRAGAGTAPKTGVVHIFHSYSKRRGIAACIQALTDFAPLPGSL
jgi:hypothetical protein